MVTLRMRLKCEIFRTGSKSPAQVYDVLNEMVIDRGPNAFLTNIECYEKGRFITRVQADGIMLSTPTGMYIVPHCCYSMYFFATRMMELVVLTARPDLTMIFISR